MARLPLLCHYLDLPLQHAHPEVLRRMRRPAALDRTYRLIESLRQAMPDIALRTSFIVGYPGETEAEFQTLLEFVQEVRFDRLGVFRYWREEGTEAAALPNQVPEPIKEERYHRLMALQQPISLARNREQVGRELEVLVESLPQGEGSPYLIGRSYRDAPEVDGLVFFKGRAQPGDLIRVKVTAALEYDLVAEPLSNYREPSGARPLKRRATRGKVRPRQTEIEPAPAGLAAGSRDFSCGEPVLTNFVVSLVPKADYSRGRGQGRPRPSQSLNR